MPKFQKKPIVIEAVQFTPANHADLLRHLEGCVGWRMASDGIEIPTLEGVMLASRGDWVIKGIKGEFYPCKPDVFAASYETAR